MTAPRPLMSQAATNTKRSSDCVYLLDLLSVYGANVAGAMPELCLRGGLAPPPFMGLELQSFARLERLDLSSNTLSSCGWAVYLSHTVRTINLALNTIAQVSELVTLSVLPNLEVGGLGRTLARCLGGGCCCR